MSESHKIRAIAFYLPQFHPIPENDEWWGKGFTEWTNTAKAKPLFPGHYQPHVPADLGFYDLRVPETRAAQADMARSAGIEGFCYYHYWFAGRRILERPFQEVLQSETPNFPFCLCWANESWTGVWHGSPKKILIEQTYPGEDDHRRHFKSLLPAFVDPRYIRSNEKPIFIIYKPHEIPDLENFLKLWRSIAIENGLPGLHLIGYSDRLDWNPTQYGFDAKLFEPGFRRKEWVSKREPIKWIKNRLGMWKGEPTKENYLNYSERFIKMFLNQANAGQYLFYPNLIHSWDNTPRAGNLGFLFFNENPKYFGELIGSVIEILRTRERADSFLFFKSWNEWAEGNHLEPDLQNGHKWLDVLRQKINV